MLEQTITIKDILALDLPIFQKAYALAQEAHKDQTHKDGKTPYMAHVDAVIVNTYRRMGGYHPTISEGVPWAESHLCLAALHDVVEDHWKTYSFEFVEEVIFSLFKDRYFSTTMGYAETYVAYLMQALRLLTKKPVKGEQNYAEYVVALTHNQHAKTVKLADLEHNMSDLTWSSLYDKYALTYWMLSNLSAQDYFESMEDVPEQLREKCMDVWEANNIWRNSL